MIQIIRAIKTTKKQKRAIYILYLENNKYNIKQYEML
jgi:hypothetical protein